MVKGVVDMEVDMVADMVVDMVADMVKCKWSRMKEVKIVN